MKKKLIIEALLLIILIYVLPMCINIKSTVYGFHTETIWDAASRTHETIVPDAGDVIQIPSELTQSAWVYATENNCLNSPVRALWEKQGSPSDSEYDNWCYVEIEGIKRYCIALAPIYGLRGDYIDIEFIDGEKIACIITDSKDIWNSFAGEYGYEYNGQVYGHNSNGKCNIMEAVLSTTYSGTLLNRFPDIKQIINGGNMGNDPDNINAPQNLNGPYNYNSQDAGTTKSSNRKNKILQFMIGGINLWADAIQVLLDGIVEDSKKDTETMGIIYSKNEIESDEELQKQIQVSDEKASDNNTIKEVDIPNIVDNKMGRKEVVYTQSTKIPVIPADTYSACSNKVNVFDINFYDTSNNNPNEFWQFIKSIVSGFSHIVIYLSAVLILGMLIWRSVLLVYSSLGDDPEGARESKEIMDGLLKAICIISSIYVLMAFMTYFYQKFLTLILNGNNSNYLIRVNVDGVYSFNTNFIGYLKYMTLKSNVIATFGSSLLYWAATQVNLFWFGFMFFRMFVMAGLTIVAPITSVTSMLNRTPREGFHIENILHFRSWINIYIRWLLLPLIGVIVYKFLICII